MHALLKKQLLNGEGGVSSGSEPPTPNDSLDEVPVSPIVEVSGDSSSEDVAGAKTVSAECLHDHNRGAHLMTLVELQA